MRILLKKSFREHSNLFLWSNDGHVWYPINYRKITAENNGDPDPFKAYEPFRKAMNKMRQYPGFYIAVFEGSYDRKKKVLRLKKNA